MYNRYLRNDDGVYTRVPMSDPPPEKQRQPPPPPGHDGRYRRARHGRVHAPGRDKAAHGRIKTPQKR